MKLTEQQKQKMEIAFKRARRSLKKGDRVCATRCCDTHYHFIFTHWEGSRACGKTVRDCHPINITKVNGNPVDFGKEAP